jgi:hypothetical protein
LLLFWSGLLRHHMLRYWHILLQQKVLPVRLPEVLRDHLLRVNLFVLRDHRLPERPVVLRRQVLPDEAVPRHWLCSNITCPSRMARVIQLAESGSRMGRGVT